MIKVRKAMISDYLIIREYDEFAGDRRFDMQRGELLIADYGEAQAVGYLKLSANEFFNRPLIALVNVHKNYRRKGIAQALIINAIDSASWHQIYTSTELSNESMQKLLNHMDFAQVGQIEGFNFDGEAELLYRYTKKT